MMNHRGLSTCGGAELTGMNQEGTPMNILRCLAGTRGWGANPKKGKCPQAFGRAFYVMSFAYDKRTVRQFSRPELGASRINRWKAYVERHGLGTVTIAPDNTNPVHAHETVLRACIWSPDMSAVWDHIIDKKWYPTADFYGDWL